MSRFRMRLPQELLDRINSADLKEQMKSQRENLASNKIENVLPVAVRWMAYGWLAWVGIDVYRFLMSDIVRPMWGVLKGILALITVLALVAAIHTQAHAAPPREQVADDLEAAGKLFCHRTFRATGWTTTSFDSGNGKRELDQDETDNTLCGMRTDGYATIWTPDGTPTVATGLNGLPAMQVEFYFGAMTLTIDESSTPTVAGLIDTGSRVGYRYYRWQSNENVCWQGKLTQMHNYWGFASGNGILNWGHPGGSISAINGQNYKSKWYRWEEYFDPEYINLAETVTVYVKNITDDLPEVSGSVQTEGVFSSGSELTEPIHEYRDRNELANDGPCTNRYMYLLMAKNLGPTERIPPAVELEGEQSPPAGSVRIARMGTLFLMGLIFVALTLRSVTT